MKKIMFNDKYGLTDAVLNGTKTQRRIVIKTNDAFERLHTENWSKEQIREWNTYFTRRVEKMNENDKTEMFNYLLNNAKYKVGEIVAVAQSYDQVIKISDEKKQEEVFDYMHWYGFAGLDNKMFVKAELMPHQIKITNVRIERLQDISDEDCLKEGIEKEERTDGKYFYKFFDVRREVFVRLRTPREAFAVLTDKVNGMGTWWRNPYVFVYDFELVK